MKPDLQAGRRIHRLRTARGLSQRAVSGEECSYAYLSRLEHQDRRASWSVLIEIAERLGTTALYLATGRMDKRCPVCGRGPGLSNKSS